MRFVFVFVVIATCTHHHSLVHEECARSVMFELVTVLKYATVKLDRIRTKHTCKTVQDDLCTY